MKQSEADAIADAIVSTVKMATEGPKISGRFAALQARIVALESRPLLKWAGVHVEGHEYAEGQLVTRSGSLWVSTAATTSTPGTPGSDWRLIVKRGEA